MTRRLSPSEMLVCYLLFSFGTTVVADATSRNIITLPSLSSNKDRIDLVQQTLCDRLDYVQKGKRTSDFQQWIQDKGGDAAVISMHGVDVNLEVDQISRMDVDVAMSPELKHQIQRGDPFLPNKIDLDLPNRANATSLVYFRGNSCEREDQPATSLQLCARTFQLGFNFGPVMASTWLAVLSKEFRKKVWYRWVASCLASSGAAFIKWGQWASTRSDMFPNALCDALSLLHNAAPAHSWEFTKSRVESSLDIPCGSLLEVFSSFDPQPLASGSIAQVHKARLKNGQLVAVKVRHPRVAQLIDMDFRLMTALARACDWIPSLRWLHIKDTVSQFSHTMAAQAHLNVEAHHLEVLNHNFQSWGHVRFPQPCYASPTVIIETFEPGKIVTDILDEYDSIADNEGKDSNLSGHDLIPIHTAKFLVTTGLSVYLKMLLVDNLMHADLHPGNIMLFSESAKVRDDISGGCSQVGEDASRTAERLRVTLVDAGMVAQLNDEESNTFIGLLASIGEGDGRAAAEFALRFSIENALDEKERNVFIAEMVELFADRCQGYGSNVDVGHVLRGILGLIREHHIRIDANYATLVINVLCIESLGRRACPSYNVLDAAKPLLQTYRNICFGRDGVTSNNGPKAFKRVKSIMPLMYVKKKMADDAFFNRQRQERTKKKAGSSF